MRKPLRYFLSSERTKEGNNMLVISRKCHCPHQKHHQNLMPVKRQEMEYVSSRAFRDQKMSHDTGITDSLQTLEFLVREISFSGTNDGSKTPLQDPPSLILEFISKHQLYIFT